MKGAGIRDAARRMSNRLDALEPTMTRTRDTDSSYYKEHSIKLKKLAGEIRSLMNTQYLADFDVAEILESAKQAGTQFEQLRIILRGIQNAAKRASTVYDAPKT